MLLSEREQSAANVYVPTFTLEADSLAVITTVTEGRHALPSMYMRQSHPNFQAVAREALYTAFGDAQPTLEPIITHFETKRGEIDIEVGYAALARLVDISSNPALVSVPLSQVEDASLGLVSKEVDLVKSGLEAFRTCPNMSWNDRLMDQDQDTLPKLARLVKNPRRFKILELRSAFEALLYDSVGATDYTRTLVEKIDPGNFHRQIKPHLTPLLEQSTIEGRGRPARLWSMPPAILTPGYKK